METIPENPITFPRIGSPAPPFEAVTSMGTLKLEDFKGGWLILFSHPADFTPVCTTEFMAFAKLHPKLREMNCELLGLSIDSVYSHIAWVRNIEEKLKVKLIFYSCRKIVLRLQVDRYPKKVLGTTHCSLTIG